MIFKLVFFIIIILIREIKPSQAQIFTLEILLALLHLCNFICSTGAHHKWFCNSIIFLCHINLHNLFLNSALVPGQPGKFRVGKVRDTSIELMWDPPFSKEPIKSYELIYRAAKHGAQVRYLIITVIMYRGIQALQKFPKQAEGRLHNCIYISLSVCHILIEVPNKRFCCLHPKLSCFYDVYSYCQKCRPRIRTYFNSCNIL